jgi:hypothetical protein
MPAASPVDPYELATDGPLRPFDLTRPWDQVLTSHGVRHGYARGFNSATQAGGFGVYVYEFRSRANALAAGGDAFVTMICDYGGEPVVVSEQPGLVAGIRPADSTVAWWVHGRRLLEVNYSMMGDHEEDVAGALSVIEMVWRGTESPDEPTTTA